MSNTKLKEQIEAAKIALVHSTDLTTSESLTSKPAAVSRILSSDINDVSNNFAGHEDKDAIVTEKSLEQTATTTSSPNDYEFLEARLEELEIQIKNQQRDLHTLLQKLRDITTKSKLPTETKTNKGKVAWILTILFCGSTITFAYHTLTIDVITQTAYSIMGQAVAIIDALSNQF